jgi:uncharacterized membrane protein YbhN (UPF0104 family)
MLLSIFSDLGGWIETTFDNIASIDPIYLVIGFAFQFGQTLLNSVAWRSVLQAAYPDKHILQKEISAAYAGGVGLNSVLPGQAGTVTYLALFRASIPGSSVATILSGAAVQAIFWSIVGGLVYLALFLSAPGSFQEALGSVWTWMGDHLFLTLLIIAATVVVLVIAARVIRQKLRAQWEQAGQGAAILHNPRRYLARVVVFQALSYLCRIAVNVTFMLAYNISPTPRNVFIVIAAASIAAVFSVAPGGVGATTAVLQIALSGQASQATITAYSVGQQAACMLANICLGAVLMVKVFGWDATRSVMHRKKHKGEQESTTDEAEELAAQLEKSRAERAAKQHPPDPGA